MVLPFRVVVTRGVYISKSQPCCGISLEENHEETQQIGSVVCFRSACYRRGCAISRQLAQRHW